MKTMTIRNIPDDIAAHLAAKAKTENRSVNATVVEVLCAASSPLAAKPKPVADFSEFCGILSKEEADAIEREIEESFEQIDPEEWK